MNLQKSVFAGLITVSLVLGWGGEAGGATETSHQELAEQGLLLLCTQLSTADQQNSALMSALDEMQQHTDDLRRGSIAPDFEMSRYALFQDHFYNPWLGMNFSYETGSELGVLDFINNNAENSARQYLGTALYEWRKGNKSSAMYLLGCAVHYFSDMQHPHHAANALGATREYQTKHSAYESWTDDRIQNYLLDSMDFTTDNLYFQTVLTLPYIADIVRMEVERRGRYAHDYYHRIFDPNNSGTWNQTALYTAANVQESLALLYYRFAHEIAKGESVTTNTTTFNVRIKTRSGYFWDTYGTDNTVLFGIEFTDGRWVEHTCDKSNYNDHEKGDNDWYSFTVEGVNGNMVRRVWLRKVRYAPEVHDDWYPQEFQLTSSDGQINRTQSVNRWFDGNWGMQYEWGRNIAEKFPSYSTNSPLHPVPGVIEAENYKIGGYYDNNSENSGGVYRSDAVDLQAASSQGFLNYNIGWTAPNEWTEYELDIMETGSYDIILITAQLSDQQVSLSLNGNSIASSIALPATGNWQHYTETRISGTSCTKGRKTLHLTFNSGGTNIDRIYIVPQGRAGSAETGVLAEGFFSPGISHALKAETLTIQAPLSGAIQLFSLDGRVLLEGNIEKGDTKVDLSSLANGIYIAKLLLEDGSRKTFRVPLQ